MQRRLASRKGIVGLPDGSAALAVAALLAAGLLAVGAGACGGSGKGAATAHTAAGAASHPHAKVLSVAASERVPPAPVELKSDPDDDSDYGSAGEDKINPRIPRFGHAASASDRAAIAALIERYYAAALAENGAKACSLLYSTLAEAVPVDYSGDPGVSYMQGAKTCPESMTLFFKHFHPQLVAEVPKLEVRLVRLEEHHGLALLGFGALPERETSFQRERRVWKMTSLLDSQLE